MNVTSPVITRIIGVAVATYLWIHYLGMPYGLIAGVTTALLFLP